MKNNIEFNIANAGLVALDSTELAVIDGGTFWKDMGYLVGAAGRIAYEIGRSVTKGGDVTDGISGAWH